MRELLAGSLVGILMAFIILSCAAKEDELVNKYCSGLSGYEYGQCQMTIY